jgi:hypothetical protein
VLPVTCTVAVRQRATALVAELRAVDAVACAHAIAPADSPHGRWTVEFAIDRTQTTAPGIPSGVLRDVLGPRSFALRGQPPQGCYLCFEAIAEGTTE